MTMRLEVLTSAFALAGTSLLCDLPFVCLPALYPGRLCQQHRLMAQCVPPLSHISVEHLISAAYRSDDRAQHILGDTQRVPLFTSQVRGCLVQLHPVTPLPFSPVLYLSDSSRLRQWNTIQPTRRTRQAYIYLHVSDDYWDAPPVGVLHQPPPKLHVLRPSLWSLHDRLANVVPHTGGMYSLLENKVSRSVSNIVGFESN